MVFVQVLMFFWCAVFYLVTEVHAENIPDATWEAPVAQEVRIPAGIHSGVYYPTHDEWVFIKPGAWNIAKSVEAQPTELKPEVVITENIQQPVKTPVKVTLKGTLKLSTAIKEIASLNHVDWLLGEGVEDKDVHADVVDVATEGAMKHVLSMSGYGFKLSEGTLHVFARETRSFALHLPPVAQGFSTTTSNESSSVAASKDTLESASTHERLRVGSRVQVENAAQGLSFWQDVEANIKSLISAKGIVSFNRSAGVVLVTDTPMILDQVADVVDTLNRRAGEQIMVDVKVIEVTLSKEHQMGIDWGALASAGLFKDLGFVTNFASENLSTGNMMTLNARADKATSGDSARGVKAVLHALESFGRVDMLSQPRLTMLNNAIASIQVGETKSYVERTSMETTSSGATVSSATLNEVHGGVTLQIIGSLVDDEVYLNVTPVVSTIEDIRTVTLGGGNKLEAPDTSTKTMSTQVRVKAGQTVAIGGLITRDVSNRRYGVPLLSRIPVLGKAFSYEKRRQERKELVIFMTPRRG